MTGDQLYDLIKEQLTDPVFSSMSPAWHYFRTKLLIHAHLCKKCETIRWEMK
jgi:hypothetical protein